MIWEREIRDNLLVHVVILILASLHHMRMKYCSCIGICYTKLFEAAKIHVQIMRFVCCF